MIKKITIVVESDFKNISDEVLKSFIIDSLYLDKSELNTNYKIEIEDLPDYNFFDEHNHDS